MAKSTLKRMRTFSGILILIFLAAVYSAVHEFRLGNSGAGLRLLAIASYASASLLALIYPVRCRVETTTRGACGRWAYGVLLGCGDVAGHRLGKLYARLGWQRGAVRAVSPGRRQPTRAYATTRPSGQYPQAITVTVADSVLTKCGFWVGVVGTAAGVAGVIIPIAGIR